MESPGARGNRAREERDAGSREEGPPWPKCPRPGSAAVGDDCRLCGPQSQSSLSAVGNAAQRRSGRLAEEIGASACDLYRRQPARKTATLGWGGVP